MEKSGKEQRRQGAKQTLAQGETSKKKKKRESMKTVAK